MARTATGKRTILRARDAYHGASPTWLARDRETPADGTIEYDYNDLSSVRAALAEADGDAAAVVVSAFRHDVGIDQELPTVEFARGLRELCDANGMVLILDDVRGGFRLDLAGSWAPLGVDPDLSAYCKAIGNGHPISALMGRDSLSEAVANTMATGSYWFTAAPMAAAKATIETMQEADGIDQLEAYRQCAARRLGRAADAHGVGIRQTGPVQIPLMLFEGDDFPTRNVPRAYRFAAELAERGVYFHPVHNGFLSTAISDEDIAHTLEASDEGLRDRRGRVSRASVKGRYSVPLRRPNMDTARPTAAPIIAAAKTERISEACSGSDWNGAGAVGDTGAAADLCRLLSRLKIRRCQPSGGQRRGRRHWRSPLAWTSGRGIGNSRTGSRS